MKNLVLIGMPACGKSTVGVILAKTTGKTFVDTDLLIQEHEGELLQEIINNKGNKYFQRLEQGILASIDTKNTVISTGGSAVYYEAAMSNLAKNGTIIYIKLPLEEIIKRLDNISTRGITMGPGETLVDLYNSRVPLYEQYADIIIDATGLSVEETVGEIVKNL